MEPEFDFHCYGSVNVFFCLHGAAGACISEGTSSELLKR